MWPGSDRSSLPGIVQHLSNPSVTNASSSQQETLADIEHISTIAGSLVSIGSISVSQRQVRYTLCDALDLQYDGEVFGGIAHDEVNSDLDESELRRELLRDKWKLLFDMFDPEGFGEIYTDDFIMALQSPEFLTQVPMNKRELLRERAKKAMLPKGPGYVTFQDFVNVMSGKRSRSFKCAVHHRDREVCSENDFHLVVEEPPLFRKMVHVIAMEVLPDERDRKYYADRYTCCPPPLFIILMTIIELAFFSYHTLIVGETELVGRVPIDSFFIYSPEKRHEVWRFVLYMVMHASWLHLVFNLCVQLLLGLPLEMVHGSSRIACIYLMGVLAGSLGTSIFDPKMYLMGASGGVYALLAAHLSNVMLNYHEMRYGLLRLTSIFIFTSFDVGFAVYARYAGDYPFSPSVSYVAHLTGALAGLTIGLLVLKNFEQKLHEQLLWWLALCVYAACIIFAVIFNVWRSWFTNNRHMDTIYATETFYNDFQVR